MNIRGRQKRAVSPTPPSSVELHNEFAIYDENEKSESRNSGPLIRREHLPSSCDSDVTGAEPSKCTEIANVCSLKDFGNTSQELVEQRIKLQSPVDKSYYSGTVNGFDRRNDTHKITYDKGQVEVVCLETENWEPISEDFLLEKESNSSDSQQCDFVNHQTKMDDAFWEDICLAKSFPIKSNRNFLKRTIPTPGKENKGQKLSLGTSTSEVIDGNDKVIGRRTRRRK